MKIVLKSFSTRKIVFISSASIIILGAFFTAAQIFYKRRKRKKQNSQKNDTLTSRNHLNSANGTSSSSLNRHSRQPSQQFNNKPSEELLELGLNYLNQAIKCWETALDSIESAAYMQSQLLALPNNEHAELVFKLRSLLDRANNVNLDCSHKLLNSSKTLQIIQSRLELRQQQYAAALLQQNSNKASNINIIDNKQIEVTRASSSEVLHYKKQTNRLSYLSDDENDYNNNVDDDQESFVSAISDVEETFEYTTFNMYRIGLEYVNENRVTCRVLRTQLLGCESDKDFLAKLYAIRIGFDKLLSDPTKKSWFIEEGKNMVTNLLVSTERDPTNFQIAYDNMVKFFQTTSLDLIKDELATREVYNLTFYDIVLDFILLDAFDDLENPPSAILAAINNRWLSQSFKETALSTAVWTVLKAKRRLLKYPNGFISHFYSINEHLVPTLAWGFLGNNKSQNELCSFLKEQIVEYLKCLFNVRRTNYSTLDHLVKDIEFHTIQYLDLLTNKFNNTQ